MKQSGYQTDSNMNKKIIFVNEYEIRSQPCWGFFASEKLEDGTKHI